MSSTSSTSSKNLSSCSTQQQMQKSSGKRDRSGKLTVDEYRYLAAGILKEQFPRIGKPSCSTIDDISSAAMNEQTQTRLKTRETGANKMKHLAKEMDDILSNVKSKDHTEEIMQLFRTTINNFVTEKRKSTKEYHRESTIYERAMRNRLIKSAQQKQQRARHDLIIVPTNTSKISKLSPNYRGHQMKTNSETSQRQQRVPVSPTSQPSQRNKEPVIKVIESSKTNFLHRCFGNQTVNVNPPILKTRVNTNNTPVARKKVNKGLKKQIELEDDNRANKQMRTIYENEQYNKLEAANKRSSHETIRARRSSSRSNSEKSKPNTAERSILKMSKRTKRNKEDTAEKNTRKSEKDSLDNNTKADNQLIKDQSSARDDSLVQRLTSFWNKKIRSDVQSVPSGHSSVSSSVSACTSSNNNTKTIKNNSNSELHRKTNTTKGNTENEPRAKSNTDIPVSTTNKIATKDGEDTKVANDLPYMKLGLMDELINILNSNVFNDPKKYQLENATECNNETKPFTQSKYNNKYSEPSSDDIEDYYESKSDESNYTKEHNEQITDLNNCLMRLTAKHSYIDEFSEDTTVLTDQSFKDVFCNEDLQTTELPEVDYELKEDRCNEKDNYDADDDDGGDDSCDNDQDYKYNNDKDSELEVEDKLIDSSNDEMLREIENPNDVQNQGDIKNKKIATTITNINDIINNLQTMIHTIESLPDELKCLNLDLTCMPIPKKLKRTLTYIIDNKPNIDENNENSLHAQQTNLSEIDEKRTKPTEHRKMEFLTSTYYFPSTFTKPIIENISCPMSLIGFPKRNDYLKSEIINIQLESYPDEPEVESVHTTIVTENNELLPFRIVNNVNHKPDEPYSYITRLTTQTKSTIFYVTNNPNKVMPSSVDRNETTSEADNGRSNVILDKPIKLENFSDFNIHNVMDVHNNKEISVNLFELNLSNDINISRRLNNTRRRRIWQHTNNDEDNQEVFGGSGDYGSSALSLPCRRTSSMSVTVSSSADNGGSQVDLNINDSDYRARPASLHLTGTRSRSEIDNFSIHNVIHETSEEQIASTNNCALIIQNKEIKPEISGTSICPSTSDQHVNKNIRKSDEMKIACHNPYKKRSVCLSPGFEILTNCQQEILTDDLSVDEQKLELHDDVSTMHASTTTLSKYTISNSDDDDEYYGDDDDSSRLMRRDLNRDYLIYYFNTEMPTIFNDNSKDFKECLVNKEDSDKYDLDDLFKTDPKIERELSSIIKVNNLSNGEKQLIAVCVLLFQNNTAILQRALINFSMKFLKTSLNTLWITTSNVVNCQFKHAKKKLQVQRGIRKSNSRFIKRFAKVVYTTVISLMLCCIIQKNFCGIPLHISFPW